MTELKINKGTSMDSWKSFQGLWRLYREDADLSEAECGRQLMYRCNEQIRVQLLQIDPNILTKPETEHLKSITMIAVVSDTMGAKRSEMLNTSQEVGEWHQGLPDKEQGKGTTGDLKLRCAGKRHNKGKDSVDFIDTAVKCALYDEIFEAE